MSLNSSKSIRGEDIIDQILSNFSMPDNLELDSLDEEKILFNTPLELYKEAGDVSLAEFKPGELLITSQRIAFMFRSDSFPYVFNDSFQCLAENITACEIINDEMVVIKTREKSYTFRIYKKITPYVHKLVNLLIRKSKAENS